VLDEKSVQLVQVRRLSRHRSLEERPDLLVAFASAQDPQAPADPPRVRVHHEDRAVERVEEDRIGGLRTDAAHPEEPCAQVRRRLPRETAEAAARAQMIEHRAERPRLLPEVPRGTDERHQFRVRERPHRARR